MRISDWSSDVCSSDLDVIIAAAQVAEQRGAHRKAVVVDLDIIFFAVDVPRRADLAGQSDEGEILAIEVGGQDEIVARGLGDVVEPAVGVLFQPPESGEIILKAVVVAIAEQADAELAVVEQETAKIALERLDADADRMKVVSVAVVAEMLVDEGFLHAEETVGAMAGPRRAHVEHAPFGYVDMVDIIGKRQALFDMGRSEGGVALDERNTADEGLRFHEEI